MTESASSTLSVRVPFAVRKRGGRKLLVSPNGTTGSAPRRRIDNTLVKALARAYRWRRMLLSGKFVTITELAEREGIAPSYFTAVLKLTLLAPDLVEAIIEGRQPESVTLASLKKPFPLGWKEQRIWFRMN